MELIYMYIEKFNNIIVDEEINFSTNFIVSIIDKQLIIQEKSSPMNAFFGENIKNITALAGKNGSGKTTILDILGMNRHDRGGQSVKRRGKAESKIVDSYIILYHIEGNYYGIEVMDDKIFENKITNFDFKNNIKNPFYKLPIGLVVEKNKDTFRFVEHFFRDWPLGYRTCDRIRISYISNQYSDRIDKGYSFIQGEDYDYLCKRHYPLNSSKKLQYQYTKNLKDTQFKFDFRNELMYMEIIPNFDYGVMEKKEKKIIEEWIKILENKLYIQNEPTLFIRKKGNEEVEKDLKRKNHKEIFILDTLSSYIIDLFIRGICGIIENNGERENEESGEAEEAEGADDSGNIDIFHNKEHIKILSDLKYKNLVDTGMLGYLADKEVEYKNLLKVIDYYNNEGLKPYDKMLCIGRYLSSRLETHIGLGSDNKYNVAIEEFIDSLSKLQKKYFKSDRLFVDCRQEIDEELMQTLEIYDEYSSGYYARYNDLSVKFRIEFRNLSEGQRKFLDLLSRIFDAVLKAKENELTIIILDEPDGSMHPEWSRKFIYILCEEMKRHKSKSVQIVLATHSPFVLSDIPLSNTVFLEQYGDKCIIVRKELKTFGANIHTLLIDNFFMNSTMGEFAKSRIEEVIKFLLYKKEKENRSDIRCTTEHEFKEFTREEIENIIEIIGEPIIAKKVNQLYLEAYDTSDLEEREKRLEEELKEIKDKLKFRRSRGHKS